MSNLQPPFDTFRLEKHAGEYKDFELSDNDPYPLKGVTYPSDYGDIEGYIGEDGANLDFFVGSNGTNYGFIRVYRPELENGEHKFYVGLTDEQVEGIKNEFEPVLIEHVVLDSVQDLLHAIRPFQKN